MYTQTTLNLINYEVLTSKKGVLYVRVTLFDSNELDKVTLFGFADLIDKLKLISVVDKYGTCCIVTLYIDPLTLKIRVHDILAQQ